MNIYIYVFGVTRLHRFIVLYQWHLQLTNARVLVPLTARTIVVIWRTWSTCGLRLCGGSSLVSMHSTLLKDNICSNEMEWAPQDCQTPDPEGLARLSDTLVRVGNKHLIKTPCFVCSILMKWGLLEPLNLKESQHNATSMWSGAMLETRIQERIHDYFEQSIAIQQTNLDNQANLKAISVV